MFFPNYLLHQFSQFSILGQKFDLLLDMLREDTHVHCCNARVHSTICMGHKYTTLGKCNVPLFNH